MSFVCSTTFGFSARVLRCMALLMMVAMACNSVAYAAGSRDTPPPSPQAFHEQLRERGLGKEVKVTRRDGSKIRGHIAALRDDAVDLQPGSGPAVTVALADVKKVSNAGHSRSARIAIGVGVGLAITVIVAAIVIDHEFDKSF